MISNITITDREVKFLIDEQTEISFDPYYFELWAKENGYFEGTQMIMKGNDYVDDFTWKYSGIQEFLEQEPAKFIEERFLEYVQFLETQKAKT